MKRPKKLAIYVDWEIRNYFSSYFYFGSNGDRLERIRNIVHNIFNFEFPLDEFETWHEWLIKLYGISRRTAKEYMRDAELHATQLVDNIGEKKL